MQSYVSLPWAAKQVTAAFSEASPKYHILPRNQYVMVQAITPIPTSSGLLNPDCSAMAVFLFMADHKATTITRTTDAVKAFDAANAEEYYEEHPDANPQQCAERTVARREWGDLRLQLRQRADSLRAGGATESEIDANPDIVALKTAEDEAEAHFDSFSTDCPVNFALATANVGVMAATNEVVMEKEKAIVYYVYAVIIVFLWLSFRNVAGVFSILLPLYIVSQLIYALMAINGIGMKVATLPVAALAVGIGVDWNSPFGPFRIDLAHVLRKVEGDDVKSISFNVGTQF